MLMKMAKTAVFDGILPAKMPYSGTMTMKVSVMKAAFPAVVPCIPASWSTEPEKSARPHIAPWRSIFIFSARFSSGVCSPRASSKPPRFPISASISECAATLTT